VSLKRVVVTGMAGISPLGTGWPAVREKLRSLTNAIVRMPEWERYERMHTRLAAPCSGFSLPPELYPRKVTRGMGRVALLGVRASELALEDAGLSDHPVITSGQTGVAYGSSSGSPDAIADFAGLIREDSIGGINATTYLRMMGHTAPVSIGLYFKAKGRIIPTSSACTSGAQGIGYAYEAVRWGMQKVMIAGGSEELHPAAAAIFDTLFATSSKNDTPAATPRPFDADRDGLVVGEGAGTLILEELEHARARGANIRAEVVGFGTNSDGFHSTHPNAETMRKAMELALADAGLEASDIGYVNAHGTATDNGDIAESRATAGVFGQRVPISSLKSYMGHTLGACGALEAWMSIHFMNEGWAAPTLNLDRIDPRCAELDYVRGAIREISTAHVMSNNFAFGGINTSLIFRRWAES
jgi:3-oxoacyl-[acyl-carrier-protein] synthase II